MLKVLAIIISAFLFYGADCNPGSSNNWNYTPTSPKDNIRGSWFEADTTNYSEGWIFTDLKVIHSFKNMDTIGEYAIWEIQGDTILLNGGKNKYDKLKYELLNQNTLRLSYFRWNAEITKYFFKDSLK